VVPATFGVCAGLMHGFGVVSASLRHAAAGGHSESDENDDVDVDDDEGTASGQCGFILFLFMGVRALSAYTLPRWFAYGCYKS
jgi:hypothetical protein